MIHLKDLFYAIAYCNQHIKTHKSECKAHNISLSRFYNIKQDIVKYLLQNCHSFGLGVTITSNEIQTQSDGKEIQLIGILLKSQSLDTLHIHQPYTHYLDLIPKESLPEPVEYVAKHDVNLEWDEQEFVKNFNLIVKWVRSRGIGQLYPELSDPYFVQKIVRWCPSFCFMWDGGSKRFIRVRYARKKWKKYDVAYFREHVTEILNDIESL